MGVLQPVPRFRAAPWLVISVLPVVALGWGEAPPPRPAPPDPNRAAIESLSFGGPACPRGSVTGTIAHDRSSFTLSFDRFGASVGPGVPITEARKDCQMLVILRVPVGSTYAITGVEFRGATKLARGHVGEPSSIHSFEGPPKEARLAASRRGPLPQQDYLLRSAVPAADQVWAPCGARAPLSLKATVLVDAKDLPGSSEMAVDSTTGKVSHTYSLAWKPCPTAAAR